MVNCEDRVALVGDRCANRLKMAQSHLRDVSSVRPALPTSAALRLLVQTSTPPTRSRYSDACRESCGRTAPTMSTAGAIAAGLRRPWRRVGRPAPLPRTARGLVSRSAGWTAAQGWSFRCLIRTEHEAEQEIVQVYSSLRLSIEFQG
jgi:hypothetical protein